MRSTKKSFCLGVLGVRSMCTYQGLEDQCGQLELYATLPLAVSFPAEELAGP